MSLKSLDIKIILDNIDIKLKYGILLDDSIRVIKEKLFLDEKYSQIPELISLKIYNSVDNTYKFISSSSDIIYEFYKNIDDIPTLYVNNLSEDTILNNKNYLLSNEDDLLLLYDNLKNNQGYVDLEVSDLEFCLRIKNVNDAIYQDEINKYIHIKNQQLNDLEKKYSNNSKLLIDFQDISTNNIDLGNYNLTINDINIKITGNNVITGVKGIFIKLNEIFNSIELNEQIPFIALNKRTSNTKTPQIKTYNDILNIVSDKQVKSWVLNEKKKLNQATYKIIKGLLIKSRLENSKSYTSINLLQNGEIYVDISFSRDDYHYLDMDFDSIYNIILNNVNDVINILNLFSGVFLQSKKIDSIENSNIVIDSIDSSIQTDFFIDRKKLGNLLNSDFLRENILEKKDTQSMEVLSAYYKKFHNNIDNENDIKGITVNIRDNPYVKDSSIINIYSANNLNQTIIIFANIFILYIMSFSINKKGVFQNVIKDRKLKELSQKKILGKEGIDFDSKKCQSIRQPKINHDNLEPLLEDSYILTHKSKDYRCDISKYPYPGFTDSDIVCCFKVNQKGNKNYIRNTDPDTLTVDVEPSNFKIKINSNGKSFDAIVIRIASDYRSGLNISNSIPRYYYLETNYNSDKPNLIPITNKNYINIIDKESNIWLEVIKLNKIVYPSSKSECNFKPNLNRSGSDFNVNSPCEEHIDKPYFGYNNKSIPCCFDKEKPISLNIKNKKNEGINNQYILKSDTKILNPGKLGYLPSELILLLNEITPENNDTFYRQGVIKDDINSLLYVILLSTDNKIKNKIVNSYVEFKNIINKYLEVNTKEFNKLNNGDLVLKYSSINSYIKSLDKNISWYETIEILEKIIKKNIIIIDIKENGKEKIELKVLCRPKLFNPKKIDRPFIILLKREKYFELLVTVKKLNPKSNNYIIDKKEFTINDKIIKFILDYYKDSCIKKNYYPDNYGELTLNNKFIPYIPLLSSNAIIKLFIDIKDKDKLGYIKYQIENSFHKINFLMTSKNIILPIFETGIISNININVASLSSLLKQPKKLLNLKTYIKIFKILKDINIKIIGIANSNLSNIGGLLLNFGTFIPYIISQDDYKFDKGIEKLSYKYYIDVDNYINESNHIDNDFNKYSIYKNTQSDDIFNLKKQLGNIFSDNETLKNSIYEIIVNTRIDRGNKIDKIFKYIYPKVNNGNNTEVLLKVIINDMLNDNRENLILNNIIVSDNFNKDEIIVRDSESVLLNINDIRNWIKKYESRLD